MTNEYLAAFVDECYQLGLREVVVSPGSRSTALALLFEEYGKFQTYVDIDERSAAFFALGIAKAKLRPVAVLCTSGSAATHYFPAVVEARHSRVPLLILTADRPHDLRFVGAPQTTDQTRLYGGFVNHFEELLPPPDALLWTYPRKVAQRAYLASIDQPAAAVQVNVPLSDPLVPDLDPSNFENGRTAHEFTYSTAEPAPTTGFTPPADKILLLAGPDHTADYSEDLLAFANRLKAPILADPLSNMRNFYSEFVLDAYDAFLGNAAVRAELKPDLIIQFGQIPVSKRVQLFITENSDIEYIQVDPSLESRNPLQTTTSYIQSSVKNFLQQVRPTRSDGTYFQLWQQHQEKMRSNLDMASTEIRTFEGRYVQKIQALLPENTQLAAANSLTIRNLDYWWKKGDSQVRILGNRGLNGIDGTISTALGISTTGNPTVLLTGDLALLHDLSGLIVGKTEELSLTIVLFNNNGGGIFSQLAQKDAPHFERLFSTPHDLDFAGLAILTGLDYQLVSNYDDFDRIFPEAIRSAGIHLLEIQTDKALSHELQQKYTRYEV